MRGELTDLEHCDGVMLVTGGFNGLCGQGGTYFVWRLGEHPRGLGSVVG